MWSGVGWGGEVVCRVVVDSYYKPSYILPISFKRDQHLIPTKRRKVSKGDSLT